MCKTSFDCAFFSCAEFCGLASPNANGVPSSPDEICEQIFLFTLPACLADKILSGEWTLLHVKTPGFFIIIIIISVANPISWRRGGRGELQ